MSKKTSRQKKKKVGHMYYSAQRSSHNGWPGSREGVGHMRLITLIVANEKFEQFLAE